MKIATLKETAKHEARVAITPDAVKKYIALGAEVVIEKGAGLGASISDSAFEAAGAKIAESAASSVAEADIVLCVQAPSESLLASMKKGAHLIGMLSPYQDLHALAAYAGAGIHAYAMELLPRISRAQSMDVLSSQSNLAGYRAVIEAATTTSKLMPMLMTAAGTIPPAKVLVLGAGVAGLQAIATAKRLGAVVSAFDVRAAVKEQVQSLGAKFVEVEGTADSETSGGYAKEMDEDYKKRQAQAIHDSIITQDIVIATALIPGKPAPELVTDAMLQGMKTGSVIVDLAAASGGNCKATKADEITTKHGVTLIGYTNMPSRASADASPLYARNLYTFISTLLVNAKEKTLSPQWEDELITGTLLTKDGTVIHPQFKS